MISAVVLAKNEEGTIRQCLESVHWCDEIIVIDDFSTDKTTDIASEYNAQVYKKKLESFADQRNFGLSQVKTDWVFFVDSDEEVTSELAKEIQMTVKYGKYDAYSIPRINVWQGKSPHFGEFLNFSLIRLAKKNAGEWIGMVHERWETKGPVGALVSPLSHHQDTRIDHVLDKIDYYSSIRASELFSQRTKSGFFGILFFPLGKFVYNYFVRLGVFDGAPGLVNAIVMSFYTFLVRGKLWLLWNESTKKT